MKTILNITATIIALQIIIVTLSIINTPPKGYQILVDNLQPYGQTNVPNQCYI